jgi:hypothetical protein
MTIDISDLLKEFRNENGNLAYKNKEGKILYDTLKRFFEICGVWYDIEIKEVLNFVVPYKFIYISWLDNGKVVVVAEPLEQENKKD